MSDFKIPFRSRVIIATAVMAALLEIIDSSIVNVAIPTMMGNLGTTLEDISWVVTGYIIANAIVLPIAGWLGVQIGRRVYYTSCIIVFTATSVACGMAPNLTVLVIFRILQGLAGGALLPTSQALIQEQFPREKAGMASAIYGMSVMIGPTIGPTLGGYLTDNFGWRSIFNINLPLGLATAFLAFLNVEDIPIDEKNAASRKSPIDFFGLTLLAIGVGSLQFVLERGQADEWFDSRAILTCTVLAVCAIPTFIWWELKTKHPIMDLRLFRFSPVRHGTMLMTSVGLMLYSLIFVLPVFVNTTLGLTAMQTGELFIPGALLTAALMPLVGNLLRHYDPRLLILWGISVAEVALLMMSRFTSATGQDDIFWPLLVRGGAMAFLFVPINTIVLGQFSGVALGQVAGMLNLFRQIGGSIGIAGLSTLLDRFSQQNYIELASHVSLLQPATWQTYHTVETGIATKMASGIGLATASSATLKLLEYRLQKEVFTMSFEQLIWVIMIAFGVSLIPLAMIRVSRKSSGPIVDGH